MTRNVRTYDHFCLLARALERVGDRWTLLVVRDLLSGAKRFTDLLERLGGITPKTLTLRLRELEDAGVLIADREPGRREVWYRLTESGTELASAIDALSWWGLRHAWRPPGPGERLHVEHLLQALIRAIEHTAQDRGPVRWHLRIERVGDYLIRSDGEHWSLVWLGGPDQPAPQDEASPDEGSADVVVTADEASLTRFVLDPTAARAAELTIDIRGDTAARDRFQRLVGTFTRSIPT
ncbi:MAG: winged helix-turn-helix transcriptional regulator [Thermoleophilia bacterium]